jgi:hypothetical protein
LQYGSPFEPTGEDGVLDVLGAAEVDDDSPELSPEVGLVGVVIGVETGGGEFESHVGGGALYLKQKSVIF